MEFIIRKNSTLPLLKMQVVKDGRGTYEDFMSFIETSTIYFSMRNTETGQVKINTSYAGFVEKIFDDPNTPPEYYLYYRFSKKDTNKIGRYEGQFLLKNDAGTLILPIREKLNILIKDSLLDDDLDYNECFIGKNECCIIGPPAFITKTPTPTPTQTQTPTVTPTPTQTSLLIDLTLTSIYYEGSINIDYILNSNISVPSDVTLNFTDILGTITGSPIVIITGVTITQNNLSGITQVSLVDGDFNNLSRTNTFTGLTVVSDLTGYTFNVTENNIYPTPTPTTTPTPTVTPTITSTQTPTPTNPCVQYITDEFGNYILTESGDYIISEINPCITPTPTPSPTNPCVQYLTDEFGNLLITESGDYIISEINPCVSPTPTRTPTSTNTPTVTPTYTPTPSSFYYYYNLLDCDNSNNKVGRGITGGLTGIYNVDIDKCYLIVGISFGPSYDYDLDSSQLVADCNDILCVQPTPTPTKTPTMTPTPLPIPLVSARYLRWTLTKKKGSADVAIQASDLVLVLNNNDVNWNPSAISTSPDSTYAAPYESAQNLVDGNILGKYCNINFGFGPAGTATIYIDNTTNIGFDSYYYNTANDEPTRDPVSWTLEISYNNVDWILIDTVTDANITNDRLTATQIFNIPPTRNGLTPQTAGDNAYQIKTDFPFSTDGLYWIANENISGGTPFQIYADMTTDGGGWTLLMVNQDILTWTHANAILYNEFSPVISGANYSIISYGDYLKGNGTTFQYMMEANQRNSYGGIWTSPQSYTFVNTGNTQTSVNLDIKFGNWVYENSGIEQRMPWYVPEGECPYITTSESANNEWWGSLIIRPGCGFNPAPWISSQIPNPGIIWYWVRNTTPPPAPSPSITPTSSQTSTPTVTPSTTPPQMVPVTFYINPNGESITFDSVVYTADTTINVVYNVYYPVECTPKPGFTFAGWNGYGVAFADGNAQSTSAVTFFLSGSNFTPSYI